jgi:hypothetical protein
MRKMKINKNQNKFQIKIRKNRKVLNKNPLLYSKTLKKKHKTLKIMMIKFLILVLVIIIIMKTIIRLIIINRKKKKKNLK